MKFALEILQKYWQNQKFILQFTYETKVAWQTEFNLVKLLNWTFFELQRNSQPRLLLLKTRNAPG